MFTSNPDHSVKVLGERELIKRIRQWISFASKPCPEGSGDDCAVIDVYSQKKILVTTDGVILNKHFTEATEPEKVGSKLIKRNISDVAAMGGVPQNMVIALMLPANLSIDWLEAFFRGIVAECINYKIIINGGDITEFSKSSFAAYITLLGSADKVVTRKGGKAGDRLIVTGSLGGSIQGKHLHFTPRLEEGQWLANRKEVRGMIDITDGLSKDLPELLPENAHARLNLSAIPLSHHANSAMSAFGDGEDYELLFALDKACDWERFYKDWQKQFLTPLTCIGTIAENNKAHQSPFVDALTNKPIEVPSGYQHLL